LEGSSEPAFCAAIRPDKPEQCSAVVHALARFVGVNRELCELIEEIQAWEKSNEGRGFNRGDASL
jgi:hypothetical protein